MREEVSRTILAHKEELWKQEEKIQQETKAHWTDKMKYVYPLPLNETILPFQNYTVFVLYNIIGKS